MNHAPRSAAPSAGAEVVDFDEVLLDACSAERRVELMSEAMILASAFAPEGRTREIGTLARALQTGVHDLQMGRAHVRLLAAALRRMARQAAG
jgi:hypothetical protein